METPAVDHDPPSLPASPVPKRTKVIDDAFPTASSASSAALQTATGTDSGLATPTPSHPHTHHDHSTTMSTAETAPSAALDAVAAPPALEVQFLSEHAQAPTRGSPYAAGHDLYSAYDAVIPARGRALVKTDIAISVPAGTYGRVAPRSGLAYKHGIDTLAGVIDADYRGNVGVILANLSDVDFPVKKGDRIAQLIVERIVMPEVKVVEKLEESVRGAGGFGSTGGFGADGKA